MLFKKTGPFEFVIFLFVTYVSYDKMSNVEVKSCVHFL